LPFYGELFLIEIMEPALNPLGALIVAPDCPAKNWTQLNSEQLIIDLLDFIEDN